MEHNGFGHTFHNHLNNSNEKKNTNVILYFLFSFFANVVGDDWIPVITGTDPDSGDRSWSLVSRATLSSAVSLLHIINLPHSGVVVMLRKWRVPRHNSEKLSCISQYKLCTVFV